MEMLWKSDSCPCQLIVNENFEYQDWIEKCFIHKNMNDVAFLMIVQNHNKGMNRTAGTPAEKRLNKLNEKNRIRVLGPGVTNPSRI